MERILRQFVLCVITAATFTAVGCSGENWDADDQENFKLAMVAYEKGDYPVTLELADKALKDQPRRFSNDGALETLYLKATTEYRMKRFADAKRNLEYVIDRTHNVNLEIKSLDVLGEIYFVEGNMKSALDAFAKMASLGDISKKPFDHSEFRRGCILQREGSWKDADLSFQRVIFHFRDGELAKKAKKRTGARYWAIDVGAYKESDDADSASLRFKSLDLPVTVEPKLRNDTLKFILLLGRFEKYSQAEKKLDDVKRICPDACIVVAK